MEKSLTSFALYVDKSISNTGKPTQKSLIIYGLMCSQNITENFYIYIPYIVYGIILLKFRAVN